MVRTITARSRLTPGELDAAVQAAAGRSNKQIAGDSHLSVRTVENHLQHVYEKLGISSRRQLAAALRDQPGTIRRRTRPERAADAEQRVERGRVDTGHVDY